MSLRNSGHNAGKIPSLQPQQNIVQYYNQHLVLRGGALARHYECRVLKR
jgi:hypothetical protein